MTYFGTDGIRGVAGEGMLAADNVVRLGRALGRALGADAPPVLLGRDTRASGPDITRQLSAGLHAEGLAVHDVGVVPTPGVAWLTVHIGASCGVVISASHNPAADNGIKVFGPDGYKASPELEQAISSAFDGLPPHAAGTGPSADPDQRHELVADWIDDLVARGGGDGALTGMTVALDCAHGAAFEAAPAVFQRLGARLAVHCASPDGTNINAGCGALRPETIAPMVVEDGAGIGFTFDGDADRMIAVDETGAVRDGDFQLAILGRRLKAEGRLPGDTVVSTVMANLGLELSLKEVGIALERTKVGDKYVSARMREGGFVLGGEQSGHLLYYGGPYGTDEGHPPATTGDGILTAVLMAHTLRAAGEPLSALSAVMRKLPQVLVNVRVTDRPDLMTLPAVAGRVATAEAVLGESGRIVLRYSGTEPLARVMVEGADQTAIDEQAHAIADAIRSAIGA